MSHPTDPGADDADDVQQPPAHAAPGGEARPGLLVIDPTALTYQEALDLVRDAYRVNEHDNPRMHYCPGPVVWTQEQDGGWRWQWNEDMLRSFATGLPDNALLLTWRICTNPGKPVAAREVGTLLFPDGTDQQQRTAASQAVTAANRHARNTVDRRAPFTKTYPGRQRGAGPVRYTAAPSVARILLAALRETDSFARLCRQHPCMLTPVPEGQSGQPV